MLRDSLLLLVASSFIPYFQPRLTTNSQIVPLRSQAIASWLRAVGLAPGYHWRLARFGVVRMLRGAPGGRDSKSNTWTSAI